jgi:DNA polymerase III subunit epsilon
MKVPVLPTYYYLDHFEEMTGFVVKTYGSILTGEHQTFIQAFGALSKDAKCLLIRMLNRRGAIFNRAHFRYSEISDVSRALWDLMACGHARRLEEEDYAGLLACLPKDVLFKGAKEAGFAEARISWAKPKLIDFYLSSISFETASEFCAGDRFVALANTRPIEFLLYLYFGKTEDGLKNFALRDLGIVRTNKAESFSARFSDGEEARASFHYIGSPRNSRSTFSAPFWTSWMGQPAPVTSLVSFAIVLSTKSASISKKRVTATWRGSFIEKGHPLLAGKGSYASFIPPMIKPPQKNS